MYPGATRGALDFGHFIWSNASLNKFLVVNIYGYECGHCGGSHQARYEEHIRDVAQRLLNLVTYLDLPSPKWVRATYISDQESNITPEFTNLFNLTPTPPTPTAPIVLHIPADQLVPSLREKDCDALDALMHGYELRTRGCRSLVLEPEDAPPAPYAGPPIQ